MVRAITSTPQNFRQLLNIDGHSSTVWRTRVSGTDHFAS
jgi:hypothetical protein